MRRLCLCVLVVALLGAGGTLLGGDAKQTGDDVLKKLQGTWKFVAQEMHGKALPPEEGKSRITFDGDKWLVRADGKVVQGGTHKFDPTKKPGQVDAAVTEGEGKGTTMIGIYELKGDTMRVCFDLIGKERPTAFTAKVGQM